MQPHNGGIIRHKKTKNPQQKRKSPNLGHRTSTLTQAGQ